MSSYAHAEVWPGAVLDTKTLLLMTGKGQNKDVCRVCGFVDDDPPWGEDGKSPTFAYCSCCGVEFGYQDASLAGIRKFRDEWIRDGAPWSDPEFKPSNWDLDKQLSSIPADFL